MASTSWPNDTNDRQVSQVQYEGLVSGYTLDGFTGWTSSAPAPCYADGTGGLVAKMRAGSTAQVRGHGYAVGDTDIPVTIAANSSGSTRIDRIVLQLDRSGTGKWNVTETVIQGTAGSGQPPALTQDVNASGKYQVLVARVNVASGATAISASDVFFEGQWVSPSGILICTRNSRPLSVLPGVQMLETDTNRVFVGTANAWKPIIEDSGEIFPTLNSQYWGVSGITPRMRRYNGQIYVTGGSMVRKAGLNAGTQSTLFSWDRKLGFTGPPTRRAASYISGLGIGDVGYFPTTDSSFPNFAMLEGGHTTMAKGDVLYLSDISWIPAVDDYWGS